MVAGVRQAAQLPGMSIALATGGSVRLDQIARVRDGYADRRQAALLDRKPVIGLSIYRTEGFDETQIANGVAQALQHLQ
ncbi:AcrB/AcrD/AcrF family protein [Xanthomonas fragariae]|nr:AcrB/AcrD/AcrF family protein [Xanthomonas fragariae]